MKYILIGLLISSTSFVSGQTMRLTDQTTKVYFDTRHLLGRLEGTFKGVTGAALLDTADLSTAYLNFSFAAGTVIQNDYQLGPNLLRKGCLDVAAFPEISLQSSVITRLDTGKYQFQGLLTVKGITKPITFPFTAKPNWGGYDFAFRFPIRKKDFNLHCSVRKKFMITVAGYGKKI